MTQSRGTYGTKIPSPSHEATLWSPESVRRAVTTPSRQSEVILRSQVSDPVLRASAVHTLSKGRNQVQESLGLPTSSQVCSAGYPRVGLERGPTFLTTGPSSFACFHICYIFVSAMK